uniref:Uncharacterized protein n=1 Tax=Helianthus annuus TaxID=4232 RepID=A0A251UKZ4_HELAN
MTKNVALDCVSLSTFTFHAARMSTPVTSGFRIPGLARLGPREEKEAISGSDFRPTTVPRQRMVAVGEEVEFKYFFISTPSL